MTEREALAFLARFINYEDRSQRQRGPGFTLDGIGCLLRLLGHPERAYPSIIVAGTKGKGSTCAMLAGMLTAAGYRTGLYTQPHLQRWRERVRVDGRLLSVADLVVAVRRLKRLVAQLATTCPAIGQPTYYELGTAVALSHFARRPVDIAVLEIGLGGRLDAVNAVTPLLTAITPISLEHTDVLGDSLAAIAGEKAGIIKPGIPVVVADQPAAAAAVIERIARARGAPLIWASQRGRVIGEGRAAVVGRPRAGQAVAVTLPAGLPGAPGGPVPLVLPLLGGHQRRNALTALALAEALATTERPVTATAALTGLAQVYWPGRLEILRRRPLVVVDGAHTPESAATLRAALSEAFGRRRLTLILAISNDKDLDGIVGALVSAADRLLVTSYGQARATPAAAIAAAVQRAGGRAEIVASVGAALDQALAVAAPDDLICVTGSLVTVGEARGHLGRRAG
jgi:dihydrofolate synthase/folylpolyglutamate synthase